MDKVREALAAAKQSVPHKDEPEANWCLIEKRHLETLCAAAHEALSVQPACDAGPYGPCPTPDACACPPVPPRGAQPAKPVELGDRFMEILRAIHGDMPDAFADSARLAFVYATQEARPASSEQAAEPVALKRGVTGVCLRKSGCLCDAEGLGSECVWLGPNDAELERRTGEPHIDGWPLYSGLPQPAPSEPTVPVPLLQYLRYTSKEGSVAEKIIANTALQLIATATQPTAKE